MLYVAAFVFADPVTFECADCPGNSFLIADDKPLSDAFSVAMNVMFAAVALGVIVSLLRRWLRATPVQRRVLVAVLFAGAALAVLLFAATTIVPITGSDPTLAGAIGIAALVPFGLVPYVFFGSLLRARIIRGGAFRELLAELSKAPRHQDLRDALAKALGDPSLELAFWLPDPKEYVDADGKPFDPRSVDPSRVVSEVRLEDRLVAVMVHDSSLLDDADLVRAVGAAAALALENVRLDAELRATVDELRELARGIHPAVLSDRGLDAALEALASRAPVPVDLDARAGSGRPSPRSWRPTSWWPRRSRTLRSTQKPAARPYGPLATTGGWWWKSRTTASAVRTPPTDLVSAVSPIAFPLSTACSSCGAPTAVALCSARTFRCRPSRRKRN